MTCAFPFTALVGQDALREALLACAVDPRIGGVLVRGERGTAKSTAVRGLAPLLPAVRVAAGWRYVSDPDLAEDSPDGPVPADVEIVERPVALVELPVGATADRVLGTLDLDRALAEGVKAFEPGLLAAAHRGILYVDEVNLLPDHLVDVLLDAAAMGRVHVEREGLSVSHPARFVLVGTMNPEEGDLRPQLLDRFGLSVDVAATRDPAQRTEVVRRRLAYDADPGGFAAGYASAEAELAARVVAARERLGAVRLPARALTLISSTCARLGVDGLRADITCARAACALAALDGAGEVGAEHIRRAALLALAHRRRRGPLEAPGLDEGELDDALERSADELQPDDEPDPHDGPDPRDDPDTDEDPDPAGPDGGSGTRAAGGADGGPGTGDQAPAERAPTARPRAGAHGPAAGPPPVRPTVGAPRDPGAFAPERRDLPSPPGAVPLLALAGRGSGAGGRRSRAAGVHAQPVDSIRPDGPVTDLAPAATLRAAALRRSGRAGIEAGDLREHVRAGREGNLVVFCVDASGSMGARRRMAAVKTAVLGVLLDAYQRRDRVALVSFRDGRAELVLPPTSSVERAAAALTALVTGGGTPLAQGLERAAALVVAERRRDPVRRSLALVVTDGRAGGGEQGRAAALRAAAALGHTADGVAVFDAEEGAVRVGLAADLARAAGARLLPLSVLSPGRGPAPIASDRRAA